MGTLRIEGADGAAVELGDEVECPACDGSGYTSRRVGDDERHYLCYKCRGIGRLPNPRYETKGAKS